MSRKDTATAVGLLGKSGIIGETAGTALRSALVNMSKPTKQAKEGLKALGIEAYDSNGKFKGLGYVFEGVRATRRALPAGMPLIGFAGAPFTLASYLIEGGGSTTYRHTKALMYADAGAWDRLAIPPASGPVLSLLCDTENHR